MAADGSSGASKELLAKVDWSSDPVVLKYQAFCRGYGPTERGSIVDHLFVVLPSYRELATSVKRSMSLSVSAKVEHSVPIEGPSRAGKTSAIRALMRKALPWRDQEGLHMSFGYLRVEAVPSVATMAQGVLRAMGDPTWNQRRTPTERLSRIGEVAEQIGLEVFCFDDLHHLVDSRGARVQHAVADSMIDLASVMRVPFMFCGLERMSAIFSANEQLRGRSGSTVEFGRMLWQVPKQKVQFREAVAQVLAAYRRHIKVEVSAEDEKFLFRLYCSAGGLMGYLILIFRVAEHVCLTKRLALSEEVLRKAVCSVVAKSRKWPDGKDPFDPEFVAIATEKTLEVARCVGLGMGPSSEPKRN